MQHANTHVKKYAKEESWREREGRGGGGRGREGEKETISRIDSMPKDIKNAHK